MEEFEVKFLEVDVKGLVEKIEKLGGVGVGETLTQVENFDFPDYRLREKHAWVRLRTEFNRTTLTYKERQGVISQNGASNDTGMKEIEVEVEDYEQTKILLLSIGLIVKFKQERKRLRYTLDNVELDFDTWPIVPTYLEIEGPSMEKVKDVADKLGFDWSKHLIGSFSQVCGRYGFSDHDYIIFTFKEQIKR